MPRREKLHDLKIGDRVKPTKEYLAIYKPPSKGNIPVIGTIKSISKLSRMTVKVLWDNRKTFSHLHHTYVEKIDDTS